MVDAMGKRHPGNDALAHLMNLIGLGFGLAFLWIATSAIRL
jgi:hypothetical protein